MDIKKKRERFLMFANQIKDLGYKVYIKNSEESAYGYIVNEKDEIGYFQLDEWGCDLHFGTMHKPSGEFGTGFGIYNYTNEISKEIIDKVFIKYPVWAKGRLSAIKKWTATEFLENNWDKDNIIQL